MNRRKARENAFISMFAALFEQSIPDVVEQFNQDDEEEYAVDEFGQGLLKLYEEHAAQVDETITACLKGWKIQRLPKVNLAILRMSVTELLYGEPDMDSVIINEAVELAKRFGDDEDYQFINGVLGTVSRGKNSGQGGEENAEKKEEETV